MNIKKYSLIFLALILTTLVSKADAEIFTINNLNQGVDNSNIELKDVGGGIPINTDWRLFLGLKGGDKTLRLCLVGKDNVLLSRFFLSETIID